MSAEVARFEAPSRVEQLFNRLFGKLLALGLGLPHNYQTRSAAVGVAGCTRRRSTCSSMAGGASSLRGAARRSGCETRGPAAACGSAAGAAGKKSWSAEILKAYLDRFKRTVQRYFPVAAGASVETFVPLAGRYPVFELTRATGAP